MKLIPSLALAAASIASTPVLAQGTSGLSADVGVISIFSGGTQTLTLSAPGQGNDFYVLLSSSAGTAPGTALEGLVLPLNLGTDPFFEASFHGPNSGIFQSFQGTLDPAGGATAKITLPVVPAGCGLVGTTVHSAFVVLGTLPPPSVGSAHVVFTSNSVSFALDATPSPPTSTSFKDVYDIFTTPEPTATACTVCHDTAGGFGSTGAGGLDLSSESVAYCELFDDAECASVAAGTPRVVPGNASVSFLMEKVLGGTPSCGSPMPLGGPTLSAGAQATIQNWINSGAPY